MRTRYIPFQPEQNYAELKPVAGGLQFSSTYDASLVSALKTRIPASGRRWDGNSKCWIIDPQYARVCVDLVDLYLGVQLAVPSQMALPKTVETKLFKLEYLGRTKQRADGELSASGWCNGGWTLVFPETVLREFFEAVPQKPNEKPTLYAVLAVKKTVTADEIRGAYRRLAKVTHPDVNHEPDAAEQFKTIQNAYEILGDELKRKKYNAGLELATSIRNNINEYRSSNRFGYSSTADGYRSPFRCGWVMASAQENLARFVVSKIIQWEDITNSQGQVMVSSWLRGADHFEIAWK